MKRLTGTAALVLAAGIAVGTSACGGSDSPSKSDESSSTAASTTPGSSATPDTSGTPGSSGTPSSGVTVSPPGSGGAAAKVGTKVRIDRCPAASRVSAVVGRTMTLTENSPAVGKILRSCSYASKSGSPKIAYDYSVLAFVASKSQAQQQSASVVDLPELGPSAFYAPGSGSTPCQAAWPVPGSGGTVDGQVNASSPSTCRRQLVALLRLGLV